MSGSKILNVILAAVLIFICMGLSLAPSAPPAPIAALTHTASPHVIVECLDPSLVQAQ